MLELYVDGACNTLSEKGGWGVVVLQDSQKRSLSGTVEKTTNNRMEIMAALEGLKQITSDAEVTLFTDSQYVLGCATKGWQRRANKELWQELDRTAGQRRVHWKWIDGASPSPYHQEAHNLANAAAGLSPEAFKSPTGAIPEVSTPTLSHLDESGRPRMVDISAKAETQREAIARGLVRMQPATFERIIKGTIAKGDVLTTAQLAGIMAAKKTPDLIPLCHPLLIEETKVEFTPDAATSTIEVTATARCSGKTGVEMEALTAVAVAALTIYDMCKAIDRGMRIENVRLVKKSGGKSGSITLE